MKKFAFGAAIILTLVSFRYLDRKPAGKSLPVHETASATAITAPATVSDSLAYSLLFRLLSTPQPENQTHLRGYIGRIGFQTPADTETLLAVAADFRKAVADIDEQARAMKKDASRAPGSTSETEAEARRQLRLRYDAVIQDSINAVFARLSEDGRLKLRNFIDTSFKQKVKLQSDSGAAL
jgi:hypothetical protein